MSIWHHLTSYKKITAPLIQEADPQGFWCSLEEGGVVLHCWSLSLSVRGHRAPRCRQGGLPLVLLRSSTWSGVGSKGPWPILAGTGNSSVNWLARNSLLLLECLHLCSASRRCWRWPCVQLTRICGDQQPLTGWWEVRRAGRGMSAMGAAPTPGSIHLPWAAAPAPEQGEHVIQSGSAPLKPKQPLSRPYSCSLVPSQWGRQVPKTVGEQ